jgi:hypothetical protein
VRSILIIVVTLIVATDASAQKLFRIDTDVAGISGTSNDVVGLIEDLLNQQGDFSGLGPQPTYTATLDYLGVANAVVLDLSLNGTSLILSLPSTGVVVPFTGATPAAVERQVEDWVKEQGTNAWAKFLQAMNGKAPAALLDGNPRATTALMANSAYRRFGLHDRHTRLGYQEQEVARFGTFGVTLEVGGGSASTNQFSGLRALDGSLEISGELGKRIGLALSIIGQYRDYKGADLYDAGVELGVPIRLRRPSEGEDLYWGVTPVIQVGGGASKDFAAGGLFMGGGLVNSVAKQLGDFEVGMGNELVYYNGLPIDNIGDYDFDTHLDQLVMKNGLRLTWRPMSLLYAETGLTVTNFLLDEAALSYYASPFVAGGVRVGRYLDLRASYEADLAQRGYRGHRGRLELAAYF